MANRLEDRAEVEVEVLDQGERRTRVDDAYARQSAVTASHLVSQAYTMNGHDSLSTTGSSGEEPPLRQSARRQSAVTG